MIFDAWGESTKIKHQNLSCFTLYGTSDHKIKIIKLFTHRILYIYMLAQKLPKRIDRMGRFLGNPLVSKAHKIQFTFFFKFYFFHGQRRALLLVF